jgi:hypothetical protein
MPHSRADLLIHVFFSTKDQRPILDDDLRLNLQKHEIESLAAGLYRPFQGSALS